MDSDAFRNLVGASMEDYCDRIVAERPSWVSGEIAKADARFLFRRFLAAPSSPVVEIGTASGFSTTVLAHAMSIAGRADLIAEDYRLATYDISPKFYADPTRRAGDAAREQLPADLLAHVVFRNPAVATDAVRDFGADSLEFAFIDANHKHPWPTIDVLIMLDAMRPGAEVVLHDINLPIINPKFPGRGVKLLFDDLTLEKRLPDGAGIPNIGSIIVPTDKILLKRQLREIAARHAWQVEIPPDILKALDLEARLP